MFFLGGHRPLNFRLSAWYISVPIVSMVSVIPFDFWRVFINLWPLMVPSDLLFWLFSDFVFMLSWAILFPSYILLWSNLLNLLMTFLFQFLLHLLSLHLLDLLNQLFLLLLLFFLLVGFENVIALHKVFIVWTHLLIFNNIFIWNLKINSLN